MEIVVVAPHVLTRAGYRVSLEAGIVRGRSRVSDVTDIGLRVEDTERILPGSDVADQPKTQHAHESAAEGGADDSQFDVCRSLPRSFQLTTMTWLSARAFLNSGLFITS
jgi:hypothetical protein